MQPYKFQFGTRHVTVTDYGIRFSPFVSDFSLRKQELPREDIAAISVDGIPGKMRCVVTVHTYSGKPRRFAGVMCTAAEVKDAFRIRRYRLYA